MSVVLATVSGLHEVVALRSLRLLIRRVHRWVILLAISGGSVGWGTTGELSGLCLFTWHGRAGIDKCSNLKINFALFYRMGHHRV